MWLKVGFQVGLYQEHRSDVGRRATHQVCEAVDGHFEGLFSEIVEVVVLEHEPLVVLPDQLTMRFLAFIVALSCASGRM